MMKHFGDMIAQMAVITAQYQAHLKATNGNHSEQIQMMLSQIQNPGGAQPGFEKNCKNEKLDSKVFTKVNKFCGEWKD